MHLIASSCFVKYATRRISSRNLLKYRRFRLLVDDNFDGLLNKSQLAHIGLFELKR